jgi:hypothetical protein
VADQISDAVLDAVLAGDPNPDAARVACETLVTTGMVVVAGEISTDTYVDIPKSCGTRSRRHRLRPRRRGLRRQHLRGDGRHRRAVARHRRRRRQVLRAARGESDEDDDLDASAPATRG